MNTTPTSGTATQTLEIGGQSPFLASSRCTTASLRETVPPRVSTVRGSIKSTKENGALPRSWSFVDDYAARMRSRLRGDGTGHKTSVGTGFKPPLVEERKRWENAKIVQVRLVWA